MNGHHAPAPPVPPSSQKVSATAQCAYCRWTARIAAPPLEAAGFLRRLLTDHVAMAHQEKFMALIDPEPQP